MTANGPVYAEPLFRRKGETYVPTAMTVGPWSPDALHGGPPTALLARAVEQVAASRGLQVSRLTVDLFRGVPMAPLRVGVDIVREGRRIAVVQASLISGQVEVSRATGLLLLPSEADDAAPIEPPPPGPGGLPDLLQAMRGPGGERMFPPMFLDAVEARFVAGEGAGERPAAWFRLPVPLVEGEEPTPFQQLAAVSDFGNLLANFDPARSRGGRRGPGYINTDTTIYLLRYPVGGWVCLRAERRRVQDGLGLVEVAQFDEQGWYGHSAHARLANARR